MSEPSQPSGPDFREILAGCPDAVSLSGASQSGEVDEETGFPAPSDVSVSFSFSERGFGFGEIMLFQTPYGTFVDTEHMNKERVKRYLCAFVDSAIDDNDQDPARHRAYNAARGRRCGEGCAACAAGNIEKP